MLFDIDAMDVKPRYNLLSSLIVPRPIAWVTTVDAAGRVNAAPFSFFNLMAGTPPVVVLGIGNRAQAQVSGIGGGRTRITRGRCR